MTQTYDERRNANQTEIREMSISKTGGWRRFSFRDRAHTRSNKIFPDAELMVEFSTNLARNDLGVLIEESFETANGQIRTHTTSITLTAKNVIKLREILNSIDTNKINP